MNYSPNCGCDCSISFDQMKLSSLPLAMAYVPMQSFQQPFELCKALQMGTIFPDLCLPFCGKGKGGKCV